MTADAQADARSSLAALAGGTCDVRCDGSAVRCDCSGVRCDSAGVVNIGVDGGDGVMRAERGRREACGVTVSRLQLGLISRVSG